MSEGGLLKGRNEAWTARGKDGGRKRAEEGLSEEGGSKGERKLQGRYPEEGTGQCTVYSQTTNNAALGLETLVLQMTNSEQVYIINCVL